MTGSRHRLVCIVTLLFIGGGTIAAVSAARSSAGIVFDDAAKKAPDPIGDSIRGAARLPVDGEFESATKLFRAGKFAEAERQFAWIAQVRQGTTWGERAQSYLAESQYQQKKYVQALESFERLYVDYPATEYMRKLVGREYEIAQLWIAQSDPQGPAEKKRPEMAHLDGRLPIVDTLASAIRTLESVRQHEPDGPLADDATIQIADYYMKQRDYNSAALYYEQFVAEYGPRKSPFLLHARFAAIEARLRDYLETPSDRRTGGLIVVIVLLGGLLGWLVRRAHVQRGSTHPTTRFPPSHTGSKAVTP